MVIRVSNRLTSSSSTNTAPAMGALKAVARPAPAPAASRARQSSSLQRNVAPSRCDTVAPIWTLGPSRPSASPEPMASSPPKNLTGMRRYGAWGSAPLKTASTCGMPLPDACGEYRRTSQAARAAAVAPSAMTGKKPSVRPCAHTSNTSRPRSTCSSASRKIAAIKPEAAPTSRDSAVRVSRERDGVRVDIAFILIAGTGTSVKSKLTGDR